MITNDQILIKKDIFFYGDDLLFETKEFFCVQALISPSEKFLYNSQIGSNVLSFFQGENANLLNHKFRVIGKWDNENEGCFLIVLKNEITTKLLNNGLRVSKFQISYDEYQYGEINIDIEVVRTMEVI